MKKMDKNDEAILRQKAEETLKNQKTKENAFIMEADALKLIHELEVHQIELEMQNEELRLAKEQAVVATDKYIELYDFAPSVFTTLSATGKIERITLKGANMLGKERSLLFYCNFDYFVAPESKHIFKKFFDQVFNSKKTESCQVMMITEDNSPLYVQIDAIVSENAKQCYMSLTNITELKLAKQALITTNKELALLNEENEKRAAELIKANIELALQNEENERRAAELIKANNELALQNEEKIRQAAELLIKSKKLAL